jgi:hypothetical protein
MLLPIKGIYLFFYYHFYHFLIVFNRQRQLGFGAPAMLETPAHRQEMFCHSILRSGLSLELIDKSFVKDFLKLRHPVYTSLQTVDHLRTTQIDIAYSRDVKGLVRRADGKFYFIIFDETPTFKNVPLLNILVVLVDVLSLAPKVELALLSSEEIPRCNAATVAASVNAAADLFQLEKVIIYNYSLLFYLLTVTSAACARYGYRLGEVRSQCRR